MLNRAVVLKNGRLSRLGNTEAGLCNQFSITEIGSHDYVYLDQSQEMIALDRVTVRGTWHVAGRAVIDDFREDQQSFPDNHSFWNVQAGETVTVPTNQEMLSASFVRVDGQLRLNGRLSLLATERRSNQLKQIKPNEIVTIPEREESLHRGFYYVAGRVHVYGFLSVI